MFSEHGVPTLTEHTLVDTNMSLNPQFKELVEEVVADSAPEANEDTEN